MNKNLDLRIRKTYMCLMNALLELLKEKNFEEITVNELCDRALVGRGTFYKHFTDKYAFLSFVLNEMLNHYIERAEDESNSPDPRSYYIAFFKAFLQFMEKNTESFGPLTSSSMTAVMLFSTSDAISGKLEEHFRGDVAAGHVLSVRPVYAARFLTGAMAQSARYLVEHPTEAKRDEIVESMSILIGKLYAADDAYENPTGQE
ncbi:MAG: TetR/AcrR family transcriptional regulator [Lachnospiraceae bacterium]|nr:TetR/AcrR family transcriptional regulator [Lachnospiraceae bacterium]